MRELEKDQSRGVRTLELAGIFVAITAVVVSIIFGIKADQSKELEVKYTAKLTLISSGAVSGDKIKTTYGGDTINNLSKLSGYIRNSGNTPVEKRDIEEPVSLEFKDGKILEFRIVETIPHGIEVLPTHTERKVIFNHGLLNPGDRIDFEILVDGHVEWPNPKFRISGIKTPVVTYADQRPVRDTITLIKLPKPIQYVCLVLISLLIMVLLIGGIVLLFSEVKKSFISPSPDNIRKVLSTVYEEIRSRNIARHASVESILNDIIIETYIKMDSGIDKQVRDIISSVKYENSWSMNDIFSAVDSAVMNGLSSSVIKAKVNKGDVLASIALLIIGLAALLVVGGSWSMILGYSL